MSVRVDVFTAGVPLYPEPLDEYKQALLYSLATDIDFTEMLEVVAFTGSEAKARQAMQEAQRNHPMATPTGSYSTRGQVGIEAFKQVIKEDVAGEYVRIHDNVALFDYYGPLLAPVTPGGVITGELNAVRQYVVPHLLDQKGYQYDRNTHELLNPPTGNPNYVAGYPVKLVVGNSFTEPKWDALPDSPVVHYSLAFYYGPGEQDCVTQGFSEDSGLVRRRSYYYCYYQTDDSYRKGYYQYFIYDPADGTYPSLGFDQSKPNFVDSYPPFIPLRINKTKVSEETPEVAKGNRELCRILGTDYDLLETEVHNNPDIADVDDAYLLYAITVQSDTQAAMAYKYAFLSNLLQTQAFDQADNAVWQVNQTGMSGTYNAQLGISAPVNVLEIETEAAGNQINKQDTNLSCSLVWEYVTYSEGPGVGKRGTYTQTISQDHYAVTYQITDTTVGVLSVKGLRHVTYIGKFLDTQRYVYKTLNDIIADPEDKSFWLPINLDILKELPSNFRSLAISEGATLYFTAVVKTKLEWYEEPSFLLVLQVVLIIVAIVTFQPQLAGFLGVQGALAVAVVTVLEIVLVAYGMQLLLQKLIEELGIEGALLVIIIAIASMFYFGIGGWDFTAYLDKLPELLMRMDFWAGLVQYVDIGVGAFIDAEMSELSYEAEKFAEEAAEAEEQMAELDDLMNPYRGFEGFLAGMKDTVEMPEHYLRRTTDVGEWETLLNFVDVYLRMATEPVMIAPK